jgi:hypothetical protein
MESFSIGTSISGLVRLFWLLLPRGFHGFQVGLFLFCDHLQWPWSPLEPHLLFPPIFLLSRNLNLVLSFLYEFEIWNWSCSSPVAVALLSETHSLDST